MKTNIPAIICAGWIALHIGMTLGMIGQHGEAFTVGWSHVAAIAFVHVSTAGWAFAAGRNYR